MGTCYMLISFLAFISVSLAAECHGKPNPNAKPNTNPIQDSPPKYIKQVRNGKLYTVGDKDDEFPVVHVWGTPYDMGYAQGELMRDKAQQMINAVWMYLEEQVEQAINGTIDIFPKWFLKDVSNLGLEVALDLNIAITKTYTGKYFYEELNGLADASGVDIKIIERIHMIGELTKGQCSMFGANGSAVDGGGLLQLRALDWNVDGPFKNFPQLTVYHPQNSSNGHAFANIGWTGWIGSITGFSVEQMAISEIGVSFPDDTFGDESRFGVPFTYLLRDIIQFDKSLGDAMKRISSAKRTCDLILGVGDGKINEFRGVEYSSSTADFFTWDNLRPEADWHPHIKDIVYWGMDWLCPGYTQVLGRQLNKYHGTLTPEITINDIVSIVQTGDLHIAVYDLTKKQVYIANAKADYESGPNMAYDRAFVKLDMTALFDEKPPNEF